jgi:hypothetical protein
MNTSGVQALLDRIYEVKFSRSVPLTVILLSAIYAIYRSTHYLIAAFGLGWWIALPTALFIELLVLGAGALVFISLRRAFIAELTQQDADLSAWGVHASMALLVVSFVALIGIAWADAWLMTEDALPSLLMTLAQITQSGMIVVFVIIALLDEREDLRAEFAQVARRSCPYCGSPVSPNNRKRHMESCPQRPHA